jgi:hypothetical protein
MVATVRQGMAESMVAAARQGMAESTVATVRQDMANTREAWYSITHMLALSQQQA